MSRLLLLFTLLFCIGLVGCSSEKERARERATRIAEIQSQLDEHYPDMELTAEGASHSPGNGGGFSWGQYAIGVKDKTGLDFQHFWDDQAKKLAPGLREAHKNAARKRDIREFLTANLPPELKVDVYIGKNERDIHIFCMNVLTAANKEAVIQALRATLDRADAALQMGGYAAQVLFTGQGRAPTGPPPYGYEGYLGVVLFPGQERQCYQLAGKYAEKVVQPKVRAAAKEIGEREGWSLDVFAKFFQINQEDLSEIFVGFDLERENDRDTTCLFMIFEAEHLKLKEYSIVTMPHAEGATNPSRSAAWKAMIPDRFRCTRQVEPPRVQIQYSLWWNVR